MASVSSLGLHDPVALQHLIREGLVPADPTPASYHWQTSIPGRDESDDDELLSTDRCVVWSRGGMVRKTFKFDVEEEPVTHALITTFLTDKRITHGSRNTSGASKAMGEQNTRERSEALVVFLKTQAHVYFLSGSSHVIHLPFEVELAMAGPNGLIIQRKARTDTTVPASLSFPKVPPNSFVSQPPSFSAASSQMSTFSIASLGSPKQLPLRPNALLGDILKAPVPKHDANGPRVFSLTDPLAEMGLVVSSRTDSRRSSPPRFLDPHEEVVYISSHNDFQHLQVAGQEPLILALTVNREMNLYTVWRAAYMEQDIFGPRRVRSANKSRRRSSFAPVAATGAATPAASGQFNVRDGGLRTASQSVDEAGPTKKLDIASTLDPDYNSEHIPRRESRRVSSMLARTDLASSIDRSTFDLAGQQPLRRGESLGSQRASLGRSSLNAQPQLNQSFHTAPVDDLLEELRASGDFEAFHSMGLHDDELEGLRKEVSFTKVKSISMEHSNVRYSTNHLPASSQYKIFALAAPSSATDDEKKGQIILCILDPNEKRLLVLTLLTQRFQKSKAGVFNRKKAASGEELVVSWGEHTGAKNVLDACKLTDGGSSRILILTQSPDGIGELTIQAPWSVPMKIILPEQLIITNIRSLGHNTAQLQREHGINRVLSQNPLALRAVKHSGRRGVVDIEGDDGLLHTLQIFLEPRNAQVKKILELCRMTLPGSRRGEGIVVGWWYAMQWLRIEDIASVDLEWTALTIIIFVMAMGSSTRPITGRGHVKSKSRSFLRSSSGQSNENWAAMVTQECAHSTSNPPWLEHRGWKWVSENDEIEFQGRDLVDATDTAPFLVRHASLARAFATSEHGDVALGMSGYLPTAQDRGVETRHNALATILTALHLIYEESKLNTATADLSSIGGTSLLPILAQLTKWLGWSEWDDVYSVETDAQGLCFDTVTSLDHIISQPFSPPSVYDWIQACLLKKSLASFITIPDLIVGSSKYPRPSTENWQELTPRTALFKKFFTSFRPQTTSVELIELLVSSGFEVNQLDTLPEAILAPLQEAIVECQRNPPTDWGKQLLDLVQRDDVNKLLYPDKHSRLPYASLFSPSHVASLDVNTICSSLMEPSSLGSFDGTAEVDRQAVTRLIFKDDRRFHEATKILNTAKPTVARCEPQPEWSESDLLEAQKDHAQTLATRTLAIPSGRGMLFFSARVPLLTERFPISGFNLHCIMKPTNNTVAVEKTTFTEEKVSWAFFHSGVAAGLSISRNAKGIDTSWILYNKPHELSNRHAGFLLALGLNGHLKNIAKWVAFKYLTPKHTMTSIGLLLGLAASYLGTMDSLITRLLSVHVTRMLPAGAAELNLSPLTQTTGIMGIGLLYCNTQHRRMSEIMLSEIEHIDHDIEEDTLRTECYRLAAGSALGFINLGKGSDLKGLHDMRLTERLLQLAVGVKKVNLVHVLDKATSAAVIAIALIFMKSEDAILARKIDVPQSVLQFDYVRPDIFLLRTMAKHLIMWSHIDASSAWIIKNLPLAYQDKSRLDNIGLLASEDLPFFNILTGLCFSIALRFAGSGSPVVRDLLLHYLDQMMRICRLPVRNYDQKLTRSTARNCQDLLALSVSMVMAGTGDIAVFRRLRTLHGRDDADTPYGSHMAAHLAVGALFLGGGTHTFGTSNLAIASLVVAFYPLFPTSILDNKCHLQAFRHFWVLAAEPRCLVTRDIATNRPVSLPLIVRLRNGDVLQRYAPCLLPELSQVGEVRTSSPEYWNVALDLESNPLHIDAFSSTQTIFVRQRPAHGSRNSAFQATLQALNDTEATQQPLEWLFQLPAFTMLTQAERALVLPPKSSSATVHVTTESTVVDARLVLERASLNSGKRDRLLGLRLLFAWADAAQAEGRKMQWIRREVVDALKAAVWMRAEE